MPDLINSADGPWKGAGRPCRRGRELPAASFFPGGRESSMTRRAFTLVEILIVVVILGILAAILVPLFQNATEETAEAATLTELQKLRNHIGVFQAREGRLPDVLAGEGTWGQIVGNRDYLQA